MFKTTKAKVIFVVIFCVICISITLGLVLYKNIDIDQYSFEEGNETAEDSTQQRDVAGIDLKGTYNENDLTIQ